VKWRGWLVSNLSYYPGISWNDWGWLHERKLGQPLPLPVVIHVTFQIHIRVISTTTLAHLLSYTNYKKTLQCIYHYVTQGNVYMDNWCHSMTQTRFLYLVLIHTDTLIISCARSYSCPYNLLSYHSNRWFKHASGADTKFGSQKWLQLGNSTDMIIGRTEVLPMWAGVWKTHSWCMYLVVHMEYFTFYINVMSLYQRFKDSVHDIDVNCLLTTSVIWYYGACNCETYVFIFIFMYSVFHSSTKMENRNISDCKPSDQNFIVCTGHKFCRVIRSRML
jgi:hypothetical protein